MKVIDAISDKLQLLEILQSGIKSNLKCIKDGAKELDQERVNKNTAHLHSLMDVLTEQSASLKRMMVSIELANMEDL